jgi:phosphatidylglycerol:prolipoprotein diacylglycerol transferase
VPPLIIQITPDPIAVSIGPLAIGWYGIAYVLAIGALIFFTHREVARRGYDPAHVGNAFLLVLPAAVIGGRLYHVIHEWETIYSADPIKIFLPPYAGLGLYGGVLGAAIAILIYVRWKRLPWKLALDVVIPGTLFAQGIARWGNFFNQELYGPPTDAPWGIAIDCLHRVAQYPCSLYPFETTGFHPLFFYESALDVTGGLVALYLSSRFLHRLRPGDVAAFWGIWYGSVRAWLETFREGWNWQVGGLPTAQLIGIAVVVIGAAWILWNHRPGSRPVELPPPWQPAPKEAPPGDKDDDMEYQTVYDDEYDEDDGDDGEADEDGAADDNGTADGDDDDQERR